jgi:hypothetical protein
MTLLAGTALVTALLGDVRPSAARDWYPWCAQYADQSNITQCLFSTFEQCLATVSGVGGSCVQNWYPPPAARARDRHWKDFYR